MRKAPWLRLPIAVAFLIPIFAIAQTPAPVQTPGRPASPQTADRQTTEWRITEKEVKAVQAELTRRGYYESKITGVLSVERMRSKSGLQNAFHSVTIASPSAPSSASNA